MIKNIYTSTLAFLFRLLITLLSPTLRIKVEGEKHLTEASVDSAIILCWHQATFVLANRFRHKRICLLTTRSTAGEIIGKTARYFGIEVIYFSESGTPPEKIADNLKVIQHLKEGHLVATAADGPLGPLHKVKPGIIELARESGKPILPVAVKISPKIKLRKRWDKYFIPLPFAKVVIHFGPPIKTEREAGNLDTLRQRIEEALSYPR